MPARMRVWCVYVSVGLHVEGKHNFRKSVLSVHFNIGFGDQTQFTRSVQQPPLHMEPSWIQFPQILMQESRILHDYIGTQGWLGIMSVSTWKESSQSPPRHHSAMWYTKLSGCLAYYCFAFHQTLSWKRGCHSPPKNHQGGFYFDWVIFSQCTCQQSMSSSLGGRWTIGQHLFLRWTDSMKWDYFSHYSKIIVN